MKKTIEKTITDETRSGVNQMIQTISGMKDILELFKQYPQLQSFGFKGQTDLQDGGLARLLSGNFFINGEVYHNFYDPDGYRDACDEDLLSSLRKLPDWLDDEDLNTIYWTMFELIWSDWNRDHSEDEFTEVHYTADIISNLLASIKEVLQ